jgi:hypothetical protein
VGSGGAWSDPPTCAGGSMRARTGPRDICFQNLAAFAAPVDLHRGAFPRACSMCVVAVCGGGSIGVVEAWGR